MQKQPKKPRTRKQAVVILASVLGGVVVFVLGIFWLFDFLGRTQTAEAAAQLLDVKKVTWTETTGNGQDTRTETKEGYDIRYRFNVGQQTIEKLASKVTFYQPGDKLKVCYNPKDPNDESLNRISKKCGQGMLFYR